MQAAGPVYFITNVRVERDQRRVAGRLSLETGGGLPLNAAAGSGCGPARAQSRTLPQGLCGNTRGQKP